MLVFGTWEYLSIYLFIKNKELLPVGGRERRLVIYGFLIAEKGPVC